MTPRLRLLILLATLPAVAAPFVPFGRKVSPLLVVTEVPWPWGLVAAPLFLGLPFVLWQLRLLITPVTTTLERVFACVLAGASAVISLVIIWAIHREDPWWLSAGCLALMASGAPLFWRLHRTASDQDIPSAALGIAYLTHAALCLTIFADDGRPVGWWLTLVASAGMAGHLVFMVRRLRRRARLAADGASRATRKRERKPLIFANLR